MFPSHDHGWQLMDALEAKIKTFTEKKVITTTVVNSTMNTSESEIFATQVDSVSDFEDAVVNAVVNYEDKNSGSDEDLTLRIKLNSTVLFQMSVTRNAGGFFKRIVPISGIIPSVTAGDIVSISGQMSAGDTSILGGSLIVTASKKRFS